MKSVRWGTRILVICLLFTVIWVSGCVLDYGSNKLDFGNSYEAQKIQASFCQTYGDPSAYNGPPRFIAPVSSTEIQDNIPRDKVTRFSTDTESIYFWVVYQNFPPGEDLHLSWIYQDNVVTTITKKTDRRSGIAVSQFVRPDTGWPTGTHTIRIEDNRNSTQVDFEIANGPTERTTFDFSGPDETSSPDLITNVDYRISGKTSHTMLSCTPPNNTIEFTGATGPAVTPGTTVQLKLFNKQNSGTLNLPPDGILIGSTNTRTDGSWEYSWNGSVHGYTLGNGQEYLVKAMLPEGMYTKVSFVYQCTGPDPGYSIMGRASSTELSCTAPGNTLTFTGSTGPAVSPGTIIQCILFNNPDSVIQDLPADGILLGSTKTRNDGSWEYSWNGYVPGYTLTNGLGYGVKYVLPSGKYTIVKFDYQCTTGTRDIFDEVTEAAASGDPGYTIYGRASSTVLSCSAPGNTLTSTGSTGPAVSPGTIIHGILFNNPDSGIQDLPADGILLGSTKTRSDGSWEYTWSGYVPGYPLTNGQEYGVKYVLPSGKYTIVKFVYQCMGTTSGMAPIPAQTTPLETYPLLSIPTPVLSYQGETTIPVYSRPLTGNLITGADLSGGLGELTIDNTAGGYDAVAVLTQAGMKEPLSGIFVRKGEKFTFNRIRDGEYDLYFILGDNWNPDTRKFMNYPSYQRFADKFSFTTTRNEYTTYRVTLYGVVQGNANTYDVGENNFPVL